MGIYKSNEQYIEEAKEKGLIPLEEYKGCSNKLLHRCMLCGQEYYVEPRAVLIKTKKGCRSCASLDDHETFIKKMKSVDKNIKIKSKYKNSKTKIKCECLLDGYEWSQRPNDLLQGIGCPKCSNHIKMTNEQFMKEFYSRNNDIELLSEYVNFRTPIVCKCKKDGYIWKSYSYDLLRGKSGCRRCSGNELLTTKTFIEAMEKINDNIEIIGEYVNSKTNIKCRCRVCNTEWSASPSNLKNSLTRCPSCVNNYKLEDIVEKYLLNNNIEYLKQKKFDGLTGVGGRKLSYDFYLPKYNILIECQGKQHEVPIEYFGGEEQFKVQKEHDKRKINYAKLHNIQLLEIWYYDINKINNILNNTLNIGEEQVS